MARLSTRILLWLHRRYRPLDRPTYDQDAYTTWLEDSGMRLYLAFYSRYASFGEKRVLDIACGLGGKAVSYARTGAAFVCGIDRALPALAAAAARIRPAGSLRVRFGAADATALPFRDASFDVVVSDDGFDHFKEPGKVLAEMVRVTAPSGYVFISFVPYFSRECSHLGSYLRAPWVHVLFSSATILDALDVVQGREQSPAHSTDESVPVLDSLSRLGVAGFCRVLVDHASDVRLVRLRLNSSRWLRPLCYLPWVRELVTDAVFCVLTKDQGAAPTRRDVAGQTLLNVLQDLGHRRAMQRRDP